MLRIFEIGSKTSLLLFARASTDKDFRNYEKSTGIKMYMMIENI